jgi:hypothetical protein
MTNKLTTVDVLIGRLLKEGNPPDPKLNLEQVKINIIEVFRTEPLTAVTSVMPAEEHSE